MMKYSKSQKGFTLIELLIVIAIIGILAAVILIALAGARQRARDAARKSDVNNIRTAIEVFATDQASGDYPVLLTDLTPTNDPTQYIQEGSDGLSDGEMDYQYDTNSDNNSYCVGIILERDKDIDATGTANYFMQGPLCPVDGSAPTGWPTVRP